MPFVVTQRCCNDASCVSVCPVDCIRPRPDEPAFVSAEMLYIDPNSCTDCGACVPACPVGAIYSDDALPPALQRYSEVNADYFTQRPLRMLPVLMPPGREYANGGPLRVAVVGSGPAACYAVQELVGRTDAQIDVYEKLPTPWGLVRSGVSPDHPETKSVVSEFQAITESEAVRLHLNVEVGTDVDIAELVDHHHAVIYASGANADRRLGIPGEDLPGSHSATEFVAWYNSHPDYADLEFDLSGERVVIVGNGNVAMDVARILTMDVDALADTDIADHALEALRRSNIREVVILARRGPAQAAYTGSEFLALGSLRGVDIVIDPLEAELDPATRRQLSGPDPDPAQLLKARLAAEYAATGSSSGGNKRIVFRYLTSPEQIVGTDHVSGVRIVGNELFDDGGVFSARPTDRTETIDTALVFRSVGYRGVPVPGLPFDERRAAIPNNGGRVHDPSGAALQGLYVTGWIKRGPTGGIGANKYCARETVTAVIEDFHSGRLAAPTGERDALAATIRDRQPNMFNREHWGAIDRAEIERGRQGGRPRVKFTSITEMIAAGRQPVDCG